MTFIRNPILAIVFLSLVVLGAGTYRLSESPGTWVDEGMIDQLSINLAANGVMGIQTAPGHFESGAYMTAGFPLLFPLALVLKIVGVGLLQARVLMVFFALILVFLVYTYMRKEFGDIRAFLSAILIVVFPPFYAYAKNVLGEIPGLLFFFLFLFLLWQYEKKTRAQRPLTLFAIGLALGLCIVTKPVFLPLIGALCITTLWSYLKKTLPPIQISGMAIGVMGFCIPVLVWLGTQFFPTDSASTILTFYANPYGLERVPGMMMDNFLRFFTESGPLYVACTFILWTLSISLRLKRGASVSFAERTAHIFSLFVLLFYLRTPGWYKYFFIPQMISLAFLPASLVEVFSRIPRTRAAALGITISIVCCLFMLHGYMLSRDSFVAESYHSSRSALLTEYFSHINEAKTVFIYRAPEAVIFLPEGISYHQYILVNKGLSLGEKEVERIGVDLFPDIIFTATTEDGGHYAEFFPGYELRDRVDRYAILTPVPL